MGRARLAIPCALAMGLAVCAPRPRMPAPEVARVPAAVPMAAFTPALVRLSAEEAAGIARAVRSEVAVQVAEGLELSLWAPEQLIADPIAISIDSLGRMFVTRTTRTNGSELEIREHTGWMVQSMTFETLEDRRRFYLSELAPERSADNQWLTDYNGDGSRDWRDLTVQKESVYRLEDTDADGLADLSRLIAQDFNDVVTDVAHDILVFNDELILTVAPDLWRLRDSDGDGVMDTRTSLAHGFDVHTGFGGHGLSGAIIGPDGRLYFKMSDRGFDIVTLEGRRLASPHSGAILRSEPDGSGMEIFATGLRNPQQIAFDRYGNLVTADNDGDNQGETERLVYITEGSDTGWRINWQFGKYLDPDNNAYKVWMAEGLYRPRFEGQAAYLLPPIAAYRAGPSGLVYNPGTALTAAWGDYFFTTIFTGSPSSARIQGFRLREEGAGFALADDRTLVTGVLATGLDFGPDGALYAADWIQGWDPKGRGRVWKLDTPSSAASPLRAETRDLIATSLRGRDATELLPLLEHADMRIRSKAQFELVERGATAALLEVARRGDHQLARIHAIWGIGQLARRNPREAVPLVALMSDGDAEIRAQAAKTLGDLRHSAAGEALISRLADEAPRVRFFAAQALGRIGYRPAVQPLIRMLQANDDRDVYLREAGVVALARIGDDAALVALADHPSRALRTAAVVALRRMREPAIARFLRDRDEFVATEAARAINDDGGIEGARGELARVLEEDRFRGEPLLRRAISANLRIGSAEAAHRVASFAARSSAGDTLRADAIAALGVWPRPSVLDRVDGHPIGATSRDSSVARAALASILEPIFSGGSPLLQTALANASGRLRLPIAVPFLADRLASANSSEVRIAALRALILFGGASAEGAVRAATNDPEPSVRLAALAGMPSLGLPEATMVGLYAALIERGTVAEQQTALAAMGQLRDPTARERLTRMVDQLGRGGIAPEIQLDLLEAASASGDPGLAQRVERIRAPRAGIEPVAAYAEALRGGSAQAGQRVVNQHPAAQCTRCHTLAGLGASVGPDLTGIGARLTREQLLEALVDPSARIAPGFGSPGSVSAMPGMGAILSRRELRDVVEYLATLR